MYIREFTEDKEHEVRKIIEVSPLFLVPVMVLGIVVELVIINLTVGWLF